MLFFTLLLLVLLALWLRFGAAPRPRISLAASMVLTLALVAANILVGHYVAPMGILLTPVVLFAATQLLCMASPHHAVLKTVLAAVLVSVQDIGTKLYAGGSHDLEGLGFIHVFLFMGLLLAYYTLLSTIWRDLQATRAQKTVAALLYPVLVAAHLWTFPNLGLYQTNHFFFEPAGTRYHS